MAQIVDLICSPAKTLGVDYRYDQLGNFLLKVSAPHKTNQDVSQVNDEDKIFFYGRKLKYEVAIFLFGLAIILFDYLLKAFEKNYA